MFVFVAALILYLEVGPLKAKAATTTKVWINKFTVFSRVFFCCGGLYPTNKHKNRNKNKHTRISRTRDPYWKVGIFLCSFLYIFALASFYGFFFCYCNFINLGFRGLRLLSFISLLYSQNYYITQINKHAVFRTFSPYPHR